MKKSIAFVVVILCVLAGSYMRVKAQGTPEYKTLRSYEASRQTWNNILIPKNLTKDQIIAIARQLHKDHPTSLYNILDDDSQFDEFVQGEISLDNPSPEKWTHIHHIAMINQMFRDRVEWELIAMDGWAKYTHTKAMLTDRIVGLEP